MGANPKLPLLAEAPGGADAAENGHASIRRSQLESSRAALAGLRALAGELRCTLVTSAGAGGVLEVAIGLSTAAALARRRVILMECDLARPVLARRLGLIPNPGLAEYLGWKATAPQILQPLDLSGAAVGAPTSVGQIVCVVGGSAPDEAAVLFATDSFAGAMGKLRKAYDLVVLAAAPLGAAELPLLAGYADAVALCAREHEVETSMRAAPELGRLPERPVGIVRVAG